MAKIDPRLYSHWINLPGFPMKVITSYGPVTVTGTASRVSDATLPAETFTLPDDLKESRKLASPN